MAPCRDCVVLGSQALIICRPTTISSRAYHPLAQPPDMAEMLQRHSHTVQNWARQPAVGRQGTAQWGPAAMAAGGPAAGAVGAGAAGHTNLSHEWLPANKGSGNARVSQAEALQRQVEAGTSRSDRSANDMPQLRNNIVGVPRLVAASSLVTASHATDQSKAAGAAGPAAALLAGAAAGSSTASQPHVPWLSTFHGPSCAWPGLQSSDIATSSSSDRSTPPGLRTTDWPVLAGVRAPRKASEAPWPHLSMTGISSSGLGIASSRVRLPVLPAPSAADALAEAFAAAQASLMVPSEYLQVDEGPERVLVLGWGPKCLMADLIKELDHGLSPLPAGSEVVFVNTHNPEDTLGAVAQNTNLDCIKVHHVNANPLLRSSMAAKLDMSTFRCALVLCDELWVDPDSYDGNGIDSLDEPSVLRLDSLVMVAQLNVRKLLEDSSLPPINIICQKVASEGLTRFEDRHRLPLGISVNLNSFSAKTLAQIAVNPLMLYPVTRLGEDAQLTIVDSSAFAGLHEAINFWQLVARCQDVGDVLLGYYAIPDHLDEPLNTVVDPVGMEERCQPRVWNCGDGHLKFILLRGMHTQHHAATTGSHDDKELETTQRAHWVESRGRSGSSGSRGGSGSSASGGSSASSASTTGSSAGSQGDA
ncbi:hypothetical protein COO60DRAFT_7439 [Scenedesmus sp. NREL 46B-D3]|nr:hypothetical protein COO60DRAFT_7439 [Scenedesmus sp. NREL 46B-D3]